MSKLELKIAHVLRAGVALSGLLMAIGWLMSLNWQVNELIIFDTYDPIPLQEVLKLHYKNQAWAQLLSYVGLGILICLPLIRVTLTGLLFWKQKDRLLAGIALVVLICLLTSFGLGLEI
jgi:uncharacterized membrane protein